MPLQASMQSILVSMFHIGLLWLSAGTYDKATSSTAASLLSNLQRF